MQELVQSWKESVRDVANSDIEPMRPERLCKELTVSLKDVIYFGDNFNDREVLRAVGYPVLVANAQPEMKEEFSTVIGSVTEEGVAYYLDDLFGLPE